MSKRRGNVVAPDELVNRYGADTMRAYLMFFAEWRKGGPWSSTGIEGVARWLNRVWNIALPSAVGGQPSADGGQPSAVDLRRITHQTIQRVTDDFEHFEFNTIVSALMEMTNALYRYRATTEGTPAWDEAITTLLKLSAPVTPHLAEEVWARRGLPYSIHRQPWPEYDAAAAAEEMITLVVQVNGKVRDRIQVPPDIGEEEAKQKALASEGAQRYLDGKSPKKVLYVPGRLVNIVV